MKGFLSHHLHDLQIDYSLSLLNPIPFCFGSQGVVYPQVSSCTPKKYIV